MTPELSEKIRALIANATRDANSLAFPKRVDADKPALLVYSTDALFAYYLGVDGRVYELDMDKFMGSLEPVTDEKLIREVYARAVKDHPELAGLLV